MPWRDELKTQHAQRVATDLWRSRSTLESPQGRVVTVSGTEFLNFCSNDYLGLANDPRLAASACQAIRQRGTGSGASHLVCGHFDQHASLESELAQFVGSEKAVVFSTGYMANLAIPQTFLGRHDLLLEDRLNHASLIDAGQSCPATMRRFPHADVEAVATRIAGSSARRKMVFTDGVFSMDGDLAPVVAMKQICDRYETLLVVDDAHGFGVLGARGTGLLEQSGILPRGNLLMIGTFGKAAGSFGAFVAGDAVYVESLIQFARTYIYTTALPPAVVAATHAAIEIMKTEPARRETLRHNIHHFRSRVAEMGLRLMNSETPIQPIVLGSADAALQASEWLKQNGIWVTAIRPPTVPQGSARLRITLTAAHTIDDLDRLIDVLDSPTMSRIAGEPT